jgi:anti-sigma factor RsiW
VIPHDRENDEEPSPQELAAFADGELGGEAAERVGAWLAGHPEARVEVDAHRRLSDLWQAGGAPEPTAAAWAAVRGRIDRGLRVPVVRRRVLRRHALWVGLALAATATAATVALMLPNRPTQLIPLPAAGAEEPYPVAGSDEVTIISIERNRLTPVVGLPPLREPLALLAADEVKVESIEAEEGMQPHVAGDADSPPMIVVPLRPETDRTP